LSRMLSPRTSPQAASIGLSSRPSRDGMVCVRACLIQAGDSRIHSWLRSVVFIAVASLPACFDTTDLNHEWIRLSPAWIKQARTHTMPSRDGLLDKPMLAACGDVRGLSILDSGCGEGRFCRILLDRGSERVLGVDLCEPMINAARELQSGKDTYRVADAEDLSFLDDHSFDLAVSYLNQCDLCDFKANTREVFRVMKPGG